MRAPFRMWRAGGRGFAILVLCLGAFTACSRPLTETETAFAHDLFGEEFDTSDIRISQGLGIVPRERKLAATVTVLHGTDEACVRVPQPRGAQPPQAFALYNRMHFSSRLYAADMALGWPRGLRFPNAIILAHELTHVWQWKNRAVTGYTPGRAVAESLRLADPYFSQADDAPTFYLFGYEQQAAIVEDFVCFTVANPNHPRRAELREILEPVFPVAAFEAAVGK